MNRITPPQARAARALVQWPRAYAARLSGWEEAELADYEAGLRDPGNAAVDRLRAALESGGAIFLDEEGSLGRGVRLKFPAKAVKAIRRLEDEGGPVADDDI